MLLVIDIGNTNIVLGVFEGNALEHSWRVSTRRDQTSDEYAVLCRNLFQVDGLSIDDVDSAAICSVVPPLNDTFDQLTRRFFGVDPLFVDPEKQTMISVRYHHPSDVGADRIVNALAAGKIYGKPAIVVDFGTATTFDAVSVDGGYVGGIIAPGVGISAEALFARAAKLPRIEIRQPSHTIGQTTVESMQSGIFFGYIGLVDGILKRMKRELGSPVVVATGGYAKLFATEYSGFDAIEEDLTMHGLRIFFEANSA
jgi:type III pantothenate kinase